MSPEEVAESLAILDLSDPKNGIHAVNLVLDKIFTHFSGTTAYPAPQIHRGTPLTTVKENFGNLLFPEHSKTRSSTYTRYASADTVLRTQSSSLVPPVLVSLHKAGLSDGLILCPSICYRRLKAAGRLHASEPHQLDIWYIKKGPPFLGSKSLFDFTDAIVAAILPTHAYTLKKVEKDISVSHPYLHEAYKGRVFYGGKDVSFMEAGVVHTRFLESLCIDGSAYSAVSAGIMLDRVAMLIKNMDDIRLLRSPDVRIREQMKTLDRFVPVSKFPPILRDFSFVRADKTTEEEIYSMIQRALGDAAYLLEEASILAQVPYQDLPESARIRLGIKPFQKNILVRITLRSHERTLLKKEANEIAERVQYALAQPVA